MRPTIPAASAISGAALRSFFPISMPAAIPGLQIVLVQKRVALGQGSQDSARAPDLGSPAPQPPDEKYQGNHDQIWRHRESPRAFVAQPGGKPVVEEHIKEHQRGRGKIPTTRRRSWREPALESFCDQNAAK